MSAGDKAALSVTRLTVQEIGGLPKCVRAAAPRRIRRPAQDALVGNIAPQQALQIIKPDRTLDPTAPLIQHIQRRRPTMNRKKAGSSIWYSGVFMAVPCPSVRRLFGH